MPDYRRDDIEEIANGLRDLVYEADMSDPLHPEIDIDKVKIFISQYSPDSSVLKKAIFQNKDFCIYLSIELIDESIDSMMKISEFIKEYHCAYSSPLLKP